MKRRRDADCKKQCHKNKYFAHGVCESVIKIVKYDEIDLREEQGVDANGLTQTTTTTTTTIQHHKQQYSTTNNIIIIIIRITCISYLFTKIFISCDLSSYKRR